MSVTVNSNITGVGDSTAIHPDPVTGLVSFPAGIQIMSTDARPIAISIESTNGLSCDISFTPTGILDFGGEADGISSSGSLYTNP